jgi:formylglycine-generating enzyme
MVELGGLGARPRTRYAGWLAIGTAVSCGYPELSRLPDAPGEVPQYSSCVGLAPTCGRDQMGSCCDPAMTVPGGTFFRGYDAATDAFNDMQYPATVSAFVLDRYEVTVGRFRTFVEAGMGTKTSAPADGAGAHPRLAESGWRADWSFNLAASTVDLKGAVQCTTNAAWTEVPGANENKPMNCVTWYEAMAFCIWDGGYLPTEAEWDLATAGGDQQRAYPWSDPADSTSIDCMFANFNPGPAACAMGPMGSVNAVGSKSPEGDGRWGHSDLAGNRAEWILDYKLTGFPEPQVCNDCAALTPGSGRVVRGGSFRDDAFHVRAASRDFSSESSRNNFTIGWRCARTPQS